MKFNFPQKILLILVLVGITFWYAQYARKKIYSEGYDQPGSLILKNLPEFEVADVNSGKVIKSTALLASSSGLFVHIWGSWCAPCEMEMPEFLSYANKLEARNLKFLLVAVNDEELKVKKFLKKFSAIPKNVVFAIDRDNKIMDLLGTLKVPETFLFNRNGKHINKFIGPQNWMAESYQTRLDFWLNGQPSDNRKIETH